MHDADRSYFRVQEVTCPSPSYFAGLEVGDLIICVNGVRVADIDVESRRTLLSRESLTLRVQRPSPAASEEHFRPFSPIARLAADTVSSLSLLEYFHEAARWGAQQLRPTAKDQLFVPLGVQLDTLTKLLRLARGLLPSEVQLLDIRRLHARNDRIGLFASSTIDLSTSPTVVSVHINGTLLPPLPRSNAL